MSSTDPQSGSASSEPRSEGESTAPLTLSAFQRAIDATFGEKDAARGLAGTFMWFTEEVGELARALKRGQADPENLREELSDVLAWLTTLATMAGIDLEDAAQRYAKGCPKCAGMPCRCGEATRFQTVDASDG